MTVGNRKHSNSCVTTRATPHTTTARSPTELLYIRKLRAELPASPNPKNKKKKKRKKKKTKKKKKKKKKEKKIRFADEESDPQEVLHKRDMRVKAYMKDLAQSCQTIQCE